MDTSFVEVEHALIEVVSETLAACDAPSTHAGPSRGPKLANGDVAFVAAIGFASNAMRGSVLVVSRKGLPEALRAEGSESDSLTVACDVLGELVNLIVGRFKGVLASRGVTLRIGTPTTACACVLRLSPPLGGSSAWHEFEAAGDTLRVRLDACFDEGFALQPASPSDDEAALAADGLFFDGGL
jgi:hypothetical protein